MITLTTASVITPPAPDEQHVEDCLTRLFDLENTYSVPVLVEAVARLIELCSCADDPAECAGCQIMQRLAARAVSMQALRGRPWLEAH